MESPYYEMTHDIAEEHSIAMSNFRAGYNKGYQDAKAELVHCRECKWADSTQCSGKNPEFFCADGRRK